MKAISKILSTAIIMAEGTRFVEFFTLTNKIDRLSSGIGEYENLMFNAKMLELENRSSEAAAIRTVAQSKLNILAIDYKLAVKGSKSAALGWIWRRPLLTKNPLYKSIREYLGE